MNINRKWFFIVPLALLLVSFTAKNLGNDEKEALLLKTMMESLKYGHYEPVQVDDKFSNNLFNSYLERIDGRKRFLVKDDIKQLATYKHDLDDQINDLSFEFFDLSALLLDAGVGRAKDYCEKALAEKIDLEKGGRIELDGEKLEYADSYAAQEQRWKDIVKYDLMSRLNNKIKAQEKQLAKDKEDRKEDFKELTRAEMIAESKKESKKSYERWFKRLEGEKRQDKLDNYLNAIAMLYDPHTNYFAPVDKENFDISMAGKLEGIGARLQSNGEETKVSSVVTGGPAWKEGTLKAEDVITHVAQEKGDFIDVSNLNLDKVVSKIRGKKGTKVRLTVRSKDGSVKNITIVRDVVIMEEGHAKSLILNYEKAGEEQIGYIKLPRFYADFRDPKGRQCANDVAREIQKLQNQGIESIILDLRDNGGGSLRDVVNMSGLFIKEGPIVQVKQRDAKADVLKDRDKRVLFDGKLIVLVNQFSASASEILAAAMQDYNRAVIVGSSSTFGKGTVQRFFDLDRFSRGNKDLAPLGNVKLTIQKFYRINGGSTQLKGVVPDIILPDTYQNIDLGEKEYDYAMEWTKIEPVKYSQDVRKVENMQDLKEQSQARVAENETFQKIVEDAQRLKQVKEDTDYSLNFEKFQAERQQEIDNAEKFDDIMKDEIEGLQALNLEVDLEAIQADEGKTARNKKWLENVKKDVYIQEALMIMNDME